MAIIVITDEREPTETLAWLLVLFALPGLGLVFYFLFGRNWKKIAARSAWGKEIFALALPTMNRVWGKYSSVEDELLEWAEPRGYAPIIKTALSADTTHVLPAYDVTILRNGEVLFDTLKEDLRNAKDTINFQVFIWERDKLTAELTAILIERVRAGVEVRLLTDYVGLHGVQEGRDQADAGGGREVPFRPAGLAQDQLHGPPQDHRDRQRDRLRGRPERGPGVHRRPAALQVVARHAQQVPRTSRRRSAEALRGALARELGREPVHRAVLPARVSARRRPLPGDHRRPGRRAAVGPGAARPRGCDGLGARAHLDPVALLHPHARHLRDHDQPGTRGQRRAAR